MSLISRTRFLALFRTSPHPHFTRFNRQSSNIHIRSLSSSSIKMASKNYPVTKTEKEWQSVLTPEQFRVLRQSGTERPFTNTEIAPKGATGVFLCAACDNPLYKTGTKFESGCGWPAFYEGIPGALDLIEDNSMGMQRTEMRCSNCGSHLGHVFKGEGFKTPTDERHCVNGVVLKFKEEK